MPVLSAFFEYGFISSGHIDKCSFQGLDLCPEELYSHQRYLKVLKANKLKNKQTPTHDKKLKSYLGNLV